MLFFRIRADTRDKQFVYRTGIQQHRGGNKCKGNRTLDLFFMIIIIPILLKRYWNYFDGSWSGTYAGRFSNDKVVLDQFYFCYNDVVEADFKYGDGAIVLDTDSIRIKENSTDIYTESQKQQMLDEIITLAENNSIHLSDSLYLYYNDWDFTVLDRISE